MYFIIPNTNAGRIVFRECTRPTPLIRAYEADPRIRPYGDVRHTKEMLEKVTNANAFSRSYLVFMAKKEHRLSQVFRTMVICVIMTLAALLCYTDIQELYSMPIIRIACSACTVTVSLFWCLSILFELWFCTNYKGRPSHPAMASHCKIIDSCHAT